MKAVSLQTRVGQEQTADGCKGIKVIMTKAEMNIIKELRDERPGQSRKIQYQYTTE
ncbi:hypothetical protein GGR92_000626 [Spirosoma lacussanchae]